MYISSFEESDRTGAGDSEAQKNRSKVCLQAHKVEQEDSTLSFNQSGGTINPTFKVLLM